MDFILYNLITSVTVQLSSIGRNTNVYYAPRDQLIEYLIFTLCVFSVDLHKMLYAQ